MITSIRLLINLARKPWLRNLKDFDDQARLINKSSPIIFDVGANVGQTTERYLHYYPNARIHAFEPYNEVADKFSLHFKQNSNVVLNRLALTDKEGESTFYLNKCHYTNSILPTENKQIPSQLSPDNQYHQKSKIRIKTTTIDNYIKTKHLNSIDILKMDTQGSEHLVLSGAKNMLRSSKISLIYTETGFEKLYKNQSMFCDIHKQLVGHGYKLFNLYNLKPTKDLYLDFGDAIYLSPNFSV